MALIVMLAALTFAYLPNAMNSAREANAASLLQSWLNIAKQRALLNQTQYGLRLNVVQATAGNNTINNVVTSCQYLEQPDDFNNGSIQSSTFPTNPFNLYNTIAFAFPAGSDLQNGNYPSAPGDTSVVPLWAVQPGDRLEIFGDGLMYNITNVGIWDTNNVYQYFYITIDPPLPFPIAQTVSYRIVRSPRGVSTETLNLPEGTVIDVNTNVAFNNLLPSSPAGATSIDIVFSPSGAVSSAGFSGSNINLWVRAPSEDMNVESAPNGKFYYGNPTIVSIFANSGFVGSYAPDPTPSNPAHPIMNPLTRVYDPLYVPQQPYSQVK